jgi:hypothetical protein
MANEEPPLWKEGLDGLCSIKSDHKREYLVRALTTAKTARNAAKEGFIQEALGDIQNGIY